MNVDFDRSLPMMLIKTLDAVMPSYREIYARYDLTDQQWRILRVLWQDEVATSAEISRRTLIPAQSLVGILDRLENKKLISRQRSDKDRRQINVVATAKSRELQEEVMPLVEQMHLTQKECVTHDDWEKLLTILDEIAGKLRRKKSSISRALEETE